MKIIFCSTSILIIALLICSCDTYFGDTVPIDTDDLVSSEKFTLAAAFTNEDSILFLRSDRSTDILREYSLESLLNGNDYPLFDEDDLEINILSDNDRVVTSFQFIPVSERRSVDNIRDSTTDRATLINNYRAFLTEIDTFTPGEIYKMAIQHPVLGSYLIEQMMPFSVEEASFQVGDDIVRNRFGLSGRKINLSWKDKIGIENFYQIKVRLINPEDGSFYVSYLDDLDPRTNAAYAFNERIVISDQDFDGQDINLDFIASNAIDILQVHSVEITSITKDWYDMVRSYNDYIALEVDIRNGYAEPFTVFSNVPDGFGFFLLGNKSIFLQR
ncbi:DUF4249 family protein [Neolewinella aurantiaca]|uniref:DUF4249 family protein n=1 Tax=Neolewinella aurantiaca TaxID=2602767 RepID=A0A5C7F2Y5_9BACT|nr:DUF4249 family protein [Neolewinella aurantiaca]TXF82106.1 DUF4249 family protein [Neolewinella aurantiaca]